MSLKDKMMAQAGSLVEKTKELADQGKDKVEELQAKRQRDSLMEQLGNAAYAATKGALIAYCRTLAIEAAKRGVTVNVIAPGFVDTAMMERYAAYRDGMERQIPAGRFARPEDVAALAAFLLGDGASYITGAVLPVDGGLTAMMGVHRT